MNEKFNSILGNDDYGRDPQFPSEMEAYFVFDSQYFPVHRTLYSTFTPQHHVFYCILFSYRIVKSFERITSQYAQQIQPNTNETFMTSLLTLRVENVSHTHVAW